MQQMTVKDMAHVLNGVIFEDGEAINLEFCNKDALTYNWRVCKDPHWNFDCYLYRLIIKQEFKSNFSVVTQSKVKDYVNINKENNYDECIEKHYFIFKMCNNNDNTERLIHFEYNEFTSSAEHYTSDMTYDYPKNKYPVTMVINGTLYHLTDFAGRQLYHKVSGVYTETDYHCMFTYSDKDYDRIFIIKNLE